MQAHDAVLLLQLKTLKLSSFHQHWAECATLAQQEGWDYGHYLSRLCELEIQKRQVSRLARRIKESGLSSNKTLSNFDFKANASIKPAQINALAESDTWLRQSQNLIIFGPSGVGKTHIASAIAYRQIELGHRVKYYSTSHLVQLLQQAKVQLRLKDLLVKLERN